ncbi:MAG: hypothetical protein E6Q06_04180 [Candidatus Moraniibacteriota bacterium]|nr:MAG: hypothetical protein E6Q06_04180 [Candidatus Moranbacteria bacterium]
MNDNTLVDANDGLDCVDPNETANAEEFDYQKFTQKYQVRRVIVDEGESLNFPMLWARFMWIVSATFEAFISKCVHGGTSTSTVSILGELKKATYFYTTAQLKELFIVTVDKKSFVEELPAASLPPYTAETIVYHIPPRDSRKTLTWPETDAFALTTRNWPHVKQALFDFVDASPPGKVTIAFYGSHPPNIAGADSLADEIISEELAERSDESTLYYHVNTAKTLGTKKTRKLLEELQNGAMKTVYRGAKIVLVMNARFTAEGLNLQIADHALIFNYFGYRRLIQVIGRVQRMTRAGPLKIVRIWTPDNRLLDPIFEGRFDVDYAEMTKIMQKPWELATERAVNESHDECISSASSAFYRIVDTIKRERKEEAALAATAKAAAEATADIKN